ncbi:MAG: cytochrome b/b6 domain-containing protein [Jannaschia sp.]
MSVSIQSSSGRSGARDLRVWDPMVRLIHWSLALTVLLNAMLTDPEGALHENLGDVALALVAIRLVWAVIGPRAARFTAFPPDPARAIRHLRGLLGGDRTVHLSHNPLGALMVYNLWATVIALGVTGYMMGTMRYFGVDWVHQVHEVAFGWLMASVALHLAGVVYDSRRSGINLVRSMVTGRKRIPAGTKVE